MLYSKAQNLNYGSYTKKEVHSEKKLGRARSISKFDEFVLTLMRLRLGLLQRDLSHRFNISEATVSRVFQTWVRFMRVELEPLTVYQVKRCFINSILEARWPNG